MRSECKVFILIAPIHAGQDLSKPVIQHNHVLALHFQVNLCHRLPPLRLRPVQGLSTALWCVVCGCVEEEGRPFKNMCIMLRLTCHSTCFRVASLLEYFIFCRMMSPRPLMGCTVSRAPQTRLQLMPSSRCVGLQCECIGLCRCVGSLSMLTPSHCASLSISCYLQPDTLLQFTVGEKHPINKKGLLKALDVLRCGALQHIIVLAY